MWVLNATNHHNVLKYFAEEKRKLVYVRQSISPDTAFKATRKRTD
jgi:hypothetical protein